MCVVRFYACLPQISSRRSIPSNRFDDAARRDVASLHRRSEYALGIGLTAMAVERRRKPLVAVRPAKSKDLLEAEAFSPYSPRSPTAERGGERVEGSRSLADDRVQPQPSTRLNDGGNQRVHVESSAPVRVDPGQEEEEEDEEAMEEQGVPKGRDVLWTVPSVASGVIASSLLSGLDAADPSTPLWAAAGAVELGDGDSEASNDFTADGDGKVVREGSVRL